MTLLHKSTNFDPGCIWFILVHHWLLWHKHIKQWHKKLHLVGYQNYGITASLDWSIL